MRHDNDNANIFLGLLSQDHYVNITFPQEIKILTPSWETFFRWCFVWVWLLIKSKNVGTKERICSVPWLWIKKIRNPVSCQLPVGLSRCYKQSFQDGFINPGRRFHFCKWSKSHAMAIKDLGSWNLNRSVDNSWMRLMQRASLAIFKREITETDARPKHARCVKPIPASYFLPLPLQHQSSNSTKTIEVWTKLWFWGIVTSLMSRLTDHGNLRSSLGNRTVLIAVFWDSKLRRDLQSNIRSFDAALSLFDPLTQTSQSGNVLYNLYF